MTIRCPNCQAPLDVALYPTTEYAKTKQILESKATADLTNQQLDSLPWRQSQKKASLKTILVTPDLLTIPIAKLVYDALTRSATKSLKLERIEYKVSIYNGGEFLQKWSPVS